MSDSLDNVVPTWASRRAGSPPPLNQSLQLASASATAPVPAGSDPGFPPIPPPYPDTPGDPNHSVQKRVDDQLPPVPPPPSGRVDPNDPTSQATQARLPEPPVPPPLPEGLQPQTGLPGANTPYAPRLHQVASSQPTDTGIPPPVSGTPSWQGLNPIQLASTTFPPVAVTIGTPESGMKNIRQLVRNPETGKMEPTGPASGYFQIEDDTWRYFAPRAGVDLQKWPTAMSAPPQVQWAVAQTMPLNRWAKGTLAGFQRQYPWARGDMTLGQISSMAGGRDEYGMPRQYLVAATDRGPGEWGRPDPSWNSDQPGMRPSSWDIPKIMSGPVPQLLALASIFARVPLTVALGAYGAMAKAQQNGQMLEYEMQKDQWNFHMKQHQDIEQLEGQDIGDALAEFKDDPDSMQQAMMGIARRYNDPAINQLAQAKNFAAIERLAQRRDTLNQPLMKMQLEKERLELEKQRIENERTKTQREQRDDAEEDAAVTAYDNQFKKDNPNATPDEIAIAHEQNRAKVQREFSTKGDATTEEKDVLDVVDADGKPTGQQVREGKNGGLFDIGTNKPFTPQQGQRVVKPATSKEVSPQGQEAQVLLDAAKADVAAMPNAPKPGTPEYNQALQAAIEKRKEKPKEATPPRPGSVDQMMEDWLNQQKQDPKRWSGGEAGKGDYTPPSPEETAKERGHLQQLASKPAVSSRQVGERLMIAANDVAKTLSAIKQLPAGTTLGIAGGAQTALGPGLVDNMRKGLANAATPQASQILATLSNGLGRSLAILGAAGSATGLVGLSTMLAKDVPAAGDKGYTVLAKLADMRQIAEAALEVLATDPNLTDDQKKELGNIKTQIIDSVPYTTAEVVQKAFNPTKENMIDLARKLGVLKDQPQGGESAMPQGATKSATGPDGQKAFLIPGKGWVHADGTPAQ